MTPNNQSCSTDQSKTLSGATPYSHQDSWKRIAVPDLDYQMTGEDAGGATSTIMSTRYMHNFSHQAVWRSPMSPLTSIIHPEQGKMLMGYSVGLMHNTSPDTWKGDPEYMPNRPETKNRIRHTGFNFYGRIANGFGFIPTDSTIPENYSLINSNNSSPASNKASPQLRPENVNDVGGLIGIAPGLKWNNTEW